MASLLLPLASKSFTKSCTIFLILAYTITIMILLCSFKMFAVCSQTPIIQVNNLLVSNLKVSNTNLAGIWLANLTMYNPNLSLSIKLSSIEASILYKHENALCFTSVDNIELGFGESQDVYVKFVTTGYEGDQPIVEYPLLKEIEEDWKQRKVRFQLRIKAVAWYEIDLPRWRKTVIMNPYSMDLDVNVASSIIGNAAKEDHDPLLMMVTD